MREGLDVWVRTLIKGLGETSMCIQVAVRIIVLVVVSFVEVEG